MAGGAALGLLFAQQVFWGWGREGLLNLDRGWLAGRRKFVGLG